MDDNIAVMMLEFERLGQVYESSVDALFPPEDYVWYDSPDWQSPHAHDWTGSAGIGLECRICGTPKA